MQIMKVRPRSFTLDRYQELAVETSPPLDTEKDRIMRGVLGLCGESGELADHIKKHYYQGHELDMEYIRKELGDILWYLAVTAEDLHYGLGNIALENVQKLRERYPDGFSTERSVHRES